MLSKINQWAHNTYVNIGVVVAFTLFAVFGYTQLGQDFLTQWVGGVASAIAIACLIFKSQGYWFWSIVNAGLWFWLFMDFQLPMLAGLQIMYVLFSLYGLTVWATVHNRIGYDVNKWKDNFGTILGLGILAYTVYAYHDMTGYAFSKWWYFEFFGVLISIIAFWMDAFKYRTNWIGWSMTNVLFFPLFIHQGLMGPAILTILFQVLCFFGMYRWYQDQKRMVKKGEVELVGGAQYA